MKLYFAITVVLCSLQVEAQHSVSVFTSGLDFRMNQFDVENIPRGPLPTPHGFPDSNPKFWHTMSIHVQYGLLFKKNWIISTTAYTRYNVLHRIESLNYSRPIQKKIKRKYNFKYDIFLDLEKKITLNKDKFFLASAGLGFTNINTKFDVTLNDTTESGTTGSIRYAGNMIHFGPRINIGIQYHRIKALINTYIIEDRDKLGLTALWIGGTLSYELLLNKKKQ